ncbi:PAS-domain containing protein [Pseudooceanicola sp.]|uniref:PAS-domain containing protein n=1 Tax=Pseudooceanicola sp. TaxID=1914328 RepID=UPI0035C76665
MSIGLAEIGIVVAVCLATAGVALVGLAIWTRAGSSAGRARGDGVAIRFLGGRVVESDPGFLQILTHNGWEGSPDSLRRFFSFRFRNLPARLIKDEDFEARFMARDPDDTVVLQISRTQDALRFALTRPDGPADIADHVLRFRKHASWLAGWVTRSSPNPVWVTDDEGQVLWSNHAYRDLAKDLGRDDGGETCLLEGLDPMRSRPDREQRRYRLQFDAGQPDRWIDVSESRENGMRMQYAVDVTAVVQAEVAQQTFVQTLTKTFAQLSTGLAIFDRNRQLALFNPALVDLTGLNAEYLSGRPGYLSFFDKLRDAHMMPEPRSYANWRERIFDLIAAAEDGRYEETWTLSSGETYRITGRPHPNGAVAFLVEDISAEVTLTRRFREQLDMSHAVIDSLDEAIAVFSPQGVLSYTNAAYRDLWDMAEEDGRLDQTVSDVSRLWQSHCEASPVWGDFRDFAVGFEERADWDATVEMRDGTSLDCRFRPLNGGATLATFRPRAKVHEMKFRTA